MVLGFLISIICFSGADSLSTTIQLRISQTQESVVNTYFSRDLLDNQEYPDSLRYYKTEGCMTFMIFTPEILFTFDESEYNDLEANRDKEFNDYLYYLQDNDITESWYRIYTDSSKRVIRIDRLGTDININFGELLYTFLPDEKGRIEYAVNYTCGIPDGGRIFMQIFYDGIKPLMIKSVVLGKNKI